MSTFNLSGRRGDTIRLLVTCTRGGVALNLTGATVWATFKRSLADADNASTTIQKSTTGGGVSVTDAAGGLALVTLDPSDTSGLTAETVYYADVQVRESSGVITTVATGRLLVALDATRASV